MGILDRVENLDFDQLGLPADTTMRIGLHAGPVYATMDPVTMRTNHFGSHVNRAARREPVTSPGCVYVSEQFAAALTMASGHYLVCECMGVADLAKGYDTCALFQLLRRE